jgi:hypothetical protein
MRKPVDSVSVNLPEQKKETRDAIAAEIVVTIGQRKSKAATISTFNAKAKRIIMILYTLLPPPKN